MSRQNTVKPRRPAKAVTPAAPAPQRRPQPPKPAAKSFDYTWSALALVLLATFIVYYPALGNLFTNWDDPGYVTENALIRLSPFTHLKDFFSTYKYQMGNYHPLTMISLALDYQAAGLAPARYHFVNVLLHVLSTGLVFWLAKLLSGRWQVAAITSALFGLHPMHVESVAWVSERKDVLYGFFYLAALISYWHYAARRGSPVLFYVISLLLFSASLLSKGQAVSLPIVLLAMDYYMKRENWSKLLIEKLPFFLLAAVFGYAALQAQASAGAIATHLHPFSERIFVGFFNILHYLFKLLLPVGLSNYHPYPTGGLPIYYYLSPLAVAGLVFLVYRAWKQDRRFVVFGSVFFLATIAMVLQFFTVGESIISDRYTYLPYIGLFFMIGEGWVYFSEKPAYQKVKTAFTPAIVIAVIAYGFTAHARTKIWHDSISLWSDTISKHEDLALAYNNRGSVFYGQKDFARAAQDFQKALQLEPNNAQVLVNMASIYSTAAEAMAGNNQPDSASTYYEQSIQYLKRSIQLSPNDPVTYSNLGNSYIMMGRDMMQAQPAQAHALIDSGLAVSDKALALDPNYAEAYNNRGNAYFDKGELRKAAAEYRKVTQLNPAHPWAWNNAGQCYSQLNEYDSAITCYTRMLELHPDNADTRFKRGLAWFGKGNWDNALADYDAALQLQPGYATIYLYRSQLYEAKKDYAKALADAEQAKSMGVPVESAYLQKLKREQM